MIRNARVERVVSAAKGGWINRRYGKSVILALILILLPHSSSVSGSARVFNRKLPFSPGERLTYEGKWGVIPAGDVTLEVLPKETIDGVEAYHFAMFTKTNAAVDLIYKIREREDSYVDVNLTRSILYKKREESKYPRDIIVNFDWDKLEATRTNFGEKSPPIRILPGTFDPLALLFILRLQDFKENAVIEIPVTDGHMNIDVKATVIKRDTIEIQGKVYPVFEVAPDMEKLDNVVKKSENPQLKIWYTADAQKIPLRIHSTVGIVSFVFELVSNVP
jgi:hypothetical protein